MMRGNDFREDMRAHAGSRRWSVTSSCRAKMSRHTDLPPRRLSRSALDITPHSRQRHRAKRRRPIDPVVSDARPRRSGPPFAGAVFISASQMTDRCVPRYLSFSRTGENRSSSSLPALHQFARSRSSSAVLSSRYPSSSPSSTAARCRGMSSSFVPPIAASPAAIVVISRGRLRSYRALTGQGGEVRLAARACHQRLALTKGRPDGR